MFPKVLKKFCGFCCGEGCWPFRRWRHPLNSTPARSCEIRTIRIRTTRIIRTICSAATRSRRRTARNNPPCRPIRPRKSGFESLSNPIFSTIRSVRCPTFRGRSRGTTTRCISIRSIPPSPLSASTTRFIRKASAMLPWVRWDRLRCRTTILNVPNTATSLLPKGSMSIPIAWKTSPSTTSNGRIFTSCTLSLDRRSSGRRISA